MTNITMTSLAKVVKNRPSELDKRIGKNIRILRRRNNVTQVDLAKNLGITSQQITKYEHGKNRISAGNLLTIAKVLGVDIAVMYEEQAILRENSKSFEKGRTL